MPAVNLFFQNAPPLYRLGEGFGGMCVCGGGGGGRGLGGCNTVLYAKVSNPFHHCCSFPATTVSPQMSMEYPPRQHQKYNQKVKHFHLIAYK